MKGGVVQISQAASIALHGMGILARHERRISVRELSEMISVSEPHAAKVFQRLTRAGLVNSLRGPSGGVELAVPASKITLYEIYEAIEGKPSSDYCLINKKHCPFGSCIFGGMLTRINEEFIKYLSSRTLADLVRSDLFDETKGIAKSNTN
jgi:Rrf2 family protein